jgi:hypothetical protein
MFNKKNLIRPSFTICVLVLLVVSVAVHAQSYVPELKNPTVKINPAVPVKAYAFNLKDVKLLDGSRLKTQWRRTLLT